MDSSSSSSNMVEFSSSSSSSDESSGEEINVRNSHALTMVSSMACYMLQNIRVSTTRTSIARDRVAAYERVMHDYFSENPLYGDDIFRRRFRMNKELFLRIVNDMEQHYPYFTQGWDARGRIRFTVLQKCTSAILQLAYGVVPVTSDEYLKMSERTSRETLQHFCVGITQLYGREYLRKPTASDIQHLYAAHESRHELPGMLVSIDFGSNNDINVLNQSPLFNDVLNGVAPESSFVVNGVQYKHGYYLVDGIYLEWATFVKTFSYPIDPKRIKFKKAQESARKDVERAFGVLKACWAILNNPARIFHQVKIEFLKKYT